MTSVKLLCEFSGQETSFTLYLCPYSYFPHWFQVTEMQGSPQSLPVLFLSFFLCTQVHATIKANNYKPNA